MRRAGVEEFVANPLGRYVAGASYFVWCDSATLCGSVHWGKPDDKSVRELIRVFDFAQHRALAGGFDVIMDSRGIESFEWSAFYTLMSYVKSQLPSWGRLIGKQAVLVPPGPLGILLGGMVPLLGGMTYAMRFFSSMEEALAWLGRDDSEAALRIVAPLIEATRGVPPLMRQLRSYLDGALLEASVERAARTLGRSARSLQRALVKLGSSYSNELAAARVRAASALLAYSDEKIDAIARQVGCASSSQLSVIFRRETGETPASFRARFLVR